MRHRPLISVPFSIICLVGLLASPLSADNFKDSLALEANYAVGEALTVGEPAAGTIEGGALVGSKMLEVPSEEFSGIHYGTVDNYFNLSNRTWGSHTLVSVFLINSRTSERKILFSTGRKGEGQRKIWSNQYGIVLTVDNAPEKVGPTLTLSNDWEEKIRISISERLKPDVEYFVAASWKDAGGGMVDLRLYVRELEDATGASVQFHEETMPASENADNKGMTKWQGQQVYLGTTAESGVASLNGAIRLFRAYTEFAESRKEFDALYQGVLTDLAPAAKAK